MKAIEELNPRGYPEDEPIRSNLVELFDRAMQLQKEYGKDLFVTSGLRSQAQQDYLIEIKKSNAKKSNHLVGAAVDFLDHDGELAKWAMDNLDVLERIGLWLESPKHTVGWLHVQIFPPKSKKRVFIP